MPASFTDFEFAFWHPFGNYANEASEVILEHKGRESRANNYDMWTLWSFKYRKEETLLNWYQLLQRTNAPVYVFCGDSAHAKDPTEKGEVISPCLGYRMVDRIHDPCGWRSCPGWMRVPNPWRGPDRIATAFVVRDVYPVTELAPVPTAQWLIHGEWQPDDPRGHGEHLIRRGQGDQLRGVRAVLRLRPPYLAQVSANPPAFFAPV